MMKYRVISYMLLVVMVLNMFKYQLPYLQYTVFKSYISKNLCVKRNETHNCCQGKCYLKKQIKMVEETGRDSESNKADNKKPQNNKEDKEFLCSHVLTPKPVEVKLFQPVNFKAVMLQGHALAVFVPPKIQNCNSIIMNSFS